MKIISSVTIKKLRSSETKTDASITLRNIDSHELQFIERAINEFYEKEKSADAEVDKEKYGSTLHRLDFLVELRDSLREQILANVEPELLKVYPDWAK